MTFPIETMSDAMPFKDTVEIKETMVRDIAHYCASVGGGELFKVGVYPQESRA